MKTLSKQSTIIVVSFYILQIRVKFFFKLTNDLLKLLSLKFLEKKVEYEPLFESSMNVVCLGDPMMVKGRGMNPVEWARMWNKLYFGRKMQLLQICSNCLWNLLWMQAISILWYNGWYRIIWTYIQEKRIIKR